MNVNDTLLVATAASHMLLYKRVDSPAPALPYLILAVAQTPGTPLQVLPTADQIADTPRALGAALDAGRCFNGPVGGRFPDNPHFQQAFDQNGIQSVLLIPLFLDGQQWGMIEATDCAQPRTWDAPSVQLLRTAAEMLATAQQSWETTRTLAEREHFIRRVMDATPGLVYVLDLTTQRTIYINRPLTPLVGYAPEQLETDGVVAIPLLLNSEDQARLAAHYRQLSAAADNQVIEIEYRVWMANGQARWVLSRDQVFVQDAAGRVLQILCISHDISARKVAEQTLAASEAQLRALRDALPDMLFIVRSDGTFLDYHAPPYAELLLPPAAFIGQRIDVILPSAVAAMAQAVIDRILSTGGVESFMYRLTIGAEEHAYEARVVHIADDACLFVIHDVTVQQEAAAALLRAKEAAESADRAKSTFLAHMSHEIRTPLTAIIGMAALLSESTLSPAQRESAEIIRTGGETLLNLIGDILDFSKIDAGQIELAIQPFDLPTICQAAIDLVSQAATRKGLALSWQIGPDVPTIVIGDSGRLRQVLVNLLANAVKFTERGEVVLRVEPRALRDEPQSERATLVFAVRDTGIGIAPDQLDQIFKPFVQADQVLARQTSGTGLGLAISHQLAELMGGQLVVVSAIGVGTTFSLILPLGIAATGPAVPQVAALLTSVAALQVLIAEDNAINQEVLRRMLEQIGATPTVVSDGAAALAAVRAAPFDLVLMDIQMPVLDGEAATQRIRALGAEITQPRIIALTASALRGDRERYLRAGMDDYLSKPVQLDDLRRVLVPLANMDEAAAPTRREGPQAAGAGVQAAHVDWQIIAQMLSSLKMPQGQATALVRDLYERELPTQLAALTAAALAEDRALVARLAHKLCGGSQQLGAQAMAAACTVLESAAQNLGRPALGDQIAQINQIYTETWALIQAHLTALA